MFNKLKHAFFPCEYILQKIEKDRLDAIEKNKKAHRKLEKAFHDRQFPELKERCIVNPR